MEKITLKFMAFRVAITLSLPSFFLSLSLALATLYRVYRYTLIWAFLFYAIYVQPLRTHSETGMCLMGHMQHAPCPMRGNDIRGKRTCFGCAFLARSGRAKWSWKVRTIDDRLMDRRTERERERQTEHTHTHIHYDFDCD